MLRLSIRPPLYLLAVSAAGLIATVSNRTVAAQELDKGTFVIRRGGEIVGREQFTVRVGTSRESRGGLTVTTRALYPPRRPVRSLAAQIRFLPDSQLISARYELLDGNQNMMLVRFSPRRITVRIGRPGQESTREFAGGPRQILADDSLFAPLSVLPKAHAGRVTLIAPRSGTRTPATLTITEPAPTAIAGEERSLIRVSLETETAVRHLWFDSRGRLLRVAVPSQDLVAVRSPLPPR